MEKHYTLLKASQLLGVTTQTLRNWDNAGKIRTIRTPGNQRRIPESEIERILSPSAYDIADISDKPQRTTVETRIIDEKMHKKAEIVKEEAEEFHVAVQKSEDNYFLMCKDIEIYDIKKDLVLEKSLLPGCMQKETKSFSQWMETRYSEETNFSAQRLMKSAFGVFDKEHAAYATGAMSLSDCYWLKRQGEDIKFMDITPYIHKEWDGPEESGMQNEYIWGPLSNLFVSGKTDKSWLDAQTLLKVNSFWEIEPYSLCSYLGLEGVTQAQKTDEGIILNNFTSTDVFYESMEQYGIADEGSDPREVMIENFKEDAVALFVVDYLVENNDRHPDDYGFLRDSNTGEYLSMAPYYNFDWVWSGNAVALPDSALQEYRGYIQSLCRRAISVSADFEYGTIIERRARELLRV